MIYPSNFEQKTGFDKTRERLRELCLSTLGSTRVDEMNFSSDYNYVYFELRLVNEFKQICLIEDNFPINHYYDVTKILKRLRIEGTFPEVQDLFDLKRSLEAIISIIRFFREDEDDKYPCLKTLTKDVEPYPGILNHINAILTNQGRIKDNASKELSAIRNTIASRQHDVSKLINRIFKSAQQEGWTDEDASVAVREGRLVIPVNAVHKRKIKGYIHDESTTGKTSYIEPAEVVELNNEIKELEYAEYREIVKILTEFANTIRPYLEDLMKSYSFLATIDFIRCKALYAIEVNGNLPSLSEHPVIEWYDAIHPVLYKHLKSENKDVVPLHISLNKKSRILIISGPNAGGKSVCLQTVGLLQYMIQCGILAPLKEVSETGIFENIFIDIGDEQSIENDLSTYSSHLMNMKYFVNHSNDKTMILIDEFGAGTEPLLGGAIAESILEELNELHCMGVITTHYTNLKHVASSSEGIINGAMLYDTNRMQPLFKLAIGEPGSSFAFEIASKIGMSEKILKSASAKVGEEHINFDKHLKEILNDKHYWEKKRENIKENEKRLDHVVEKYNNELSEISKIRKEILTKAKVDAQQILDDVNKKIENTIRTIKESNAEKEKTKEVRNELEKLKEVIHESEPEDEWLIKQIDKMKQREERKNKYRPETAKKTDEKNQKIKISIIKGDKVRIVGQNTIGEVLEVNGESIMVVFGNMTTTLPEKRLEKISSNEFKKLSKTDSAYISNRSTFDFSDRKLNFKSQIDVRGMRGDEALQEVTGFIDDAIMAGVNEVKILHGKGNGILRQLIREYLATVNVVQSVADEIIEQGGAGITVVKLD